MSYLTLNVGSAPSTPASTKESVFANSFDKRPYAIDDAGIVKRFCTGVGGNSAATAAINTTETVVAGGNASNGAQSSGAIPANYLQVGSIVRFTVSGTCTATVANASTFTIRFGANGTTADASVATAAVTSANAGSAIPFRIVIEFQVQTVGASGTIAGVMQIVNNGTTGISTTATNVVALTASNINTTANAYISLTYKSAATTTTSTFTYGQVEVLK